MIQSEKGVLVEMEGGLQKLTETFCHIQTSSGAFLGYPEKIKIKY